MVPVHLHQSRHEANRLASERDDAHAGAERQCPIGLVKRSERFQQGHPRQIAIMFIFRKCVCRLLRFVALVEAVAFCCSPYLASNLLASGHLVAQSLNGVPSHGGVLFAALMMTGLESMGLYNLRQRARVDGIIARILISAFGSSWKTVYLAAVDANRWRKRGLMGGDGAHCVLVRLDWRAHGCTSLATDGISNAVYWCWVVVHGRARCCQCAGVAISAD